MKAKKIVLGASDITLYMCPNCNKGHQVKLGIPECDICHTPLEWEKEDLKKVR